MLDLALNTQNSVIIKSPIGGVVTTVGANKGDIVVDNTELLSISDLSSLVFDAEAPLETLPLLRSGLKGFVRFNALPDSSYPVSVFNIGAESDSQSQHVNVLLKFAVPISRFAQIKTEMPGVARIITGVHKNVLLVSRKALLRDDENKHLFGHSNNTRFAVAHSTGCSKCNK